VGVDRRIHKRLGTVGQQRVVLSMHGCAPLRVL
jgi:hypothetical protein